MINNIKLIENAEIAIVVYNGNKIKKIGLNKAGTNPESFRRLEMRAKHQCTSLYKIE